MKVMAVSSNGNMFKLEKLDEKDGYVWYFLGDNVKGFAKTIKVGEDIDVKVEEINSQKTITFITKKTSTLVNSKVFIGGEGKTTEKKSWTPYQKSPEESEKIKRLSILSSVCTAVSAIQGQVDPNTLPTIIESLFDKFYKKISA